MTDLPQGKTNVVCPSRREAILQGLLRIGPGDHLICCVGVPFCGLQGESAERAQAAGCALCERWMMTRAGTIIRLPNPVS